MVNMSRGMHIDPTRFEDLKKKNESYEFAPSNFNFINEHKGFRKGKIHIILGTSGSGKTTLVNSLLVELLEQGKKIMHISSEENAEDIATAHSYKNTNKKIDYKNLAIVSEADLIERMGGVLDQPSETIKQYEMAFSENEYDIVVFDNITTSQFYEENKRAVEFFTEFKKWIIKENVPCVLVAHTNNISENQYFGLENIRGYKTVSNKAEYIYCFYRLSVVLQSHTQIVSMVYIDKSRGHPGKTVFRLSYDSGTKSFVNDEKISYETFMKFFKRGK